VKQILNFDQYLIFIIEYCIDSAGNDVHIRAKTALNCIEYLYNDEKLGTSDNKTRADKRLIKGRRLQITTIKTENDADAMNLCR